MTQGKESENGLNSFTRSSLAYQNLFQPTKENLVDVSNIPSGMVHALTSLRTYGYQFDGIIAQIRARQLWYIERQVAKESVNKCWIEPDKEKEEKDGHWQVNILKGSNEQKAEVKKRMNALIASDVVDSEKFFVRVLLDSYCHVSRGKNGYFLDKGKEMAESELLARNPDDAEEKPQRRLQ